MNTKQKLFVLNIFSFSSIKIASILIVTAFLSSCVSTQVRDFTDPDYISFSAHKLLVEPPSHLFEKSFSDELKNINVEYALTTNIFLPTRTYTPKERIEIMHKNGFDSLLTIEILGGKRSSNVVGYNSFSTANAYSSGYGNAYATGTSTSIPIVAHNRNTQAQAKLYDLKEGRVIWVGNLKTAASGAFFMSDSSTVNSMTDEIISALLLKGHLKKNK